MPQAFEPGSVVVQAHTTLESQKAAHGPVSRKEDLQDYWTLRIAEMADIESSHSHKLSANAEFIENHEHYLECRSRGALTEEGPASGQEVQLAAWLLGLAPGECINCLDDPAEPSRIPPGESSSVINWASLSYYT